jgi:tRNA A-37 threonylcarbamoyl transferase component Bud32
MVPQAAAQGNDPLPHSAAVDNTRGHARAVPAVAAALRELLAHDIETWPQHGFRARKERTVRTVLEGELGGVPVHIKVFRPDTFADHARDLWRGPRGGRECDNLVRARALGLPTVEPLAHGQGRAGDRPRSFVVTRTAAGVPFRFDLGAADLARTGALLRNVHDRGMAPDDLHPGNLLVDTSGGLHLLDLTSVRHAGELDLRRRARALAFFCHELDGGALDPIAAPLLRGYLDAGAQPLPGLEAELRLATHRWRAAALPQFGRRAFRPCRHTEVPPHRRGLARWCWHLGGADPALRAQCEQFAAAPPAPHKSGRRGAVWLLEALAVKDRDAGKARRLWQAHYWLLFAQVPAPTPVALRRRAGQGQVFAQRLSGPSLQAELAAGRLDRPALLAAAAALGTAVGRLHAHGLGNRDLKFDNLVRDPATATVAMVDLDGVRRRSADETRGRGADLGRLLAAFRGAGEPAGRAALTTFLRAYRRAHRALLQHPPLRRVLRAAERRALEWASAHRQTGNSA